MQIPNQPSKKKVLLVEDELFIRDLYARILEKHGYSVLAAADGQKGLELAQQSPDVILLDIMLPKLSGIEVLEKLKQDQATKQIPVMLLSNLGHEQTIKQAFDLGAQGYVMKLRLEATELPEYVEKFIQDPTYKMDLISLQLD